jgi:hypothetical protein
MKLKNNAPHLKLEVWPFSIAMWEKTNDAGYPYYTGSLQKSIKNKDTGKWERMEISIIDRDLLSLAALVRATHDRLKVQDITTPPKTIASTVITSADVETPF